jgi:hypothetical protein
VCVAIADYDDVVSGVPVEQALSDWPYSKAVLRLHGQFSRAGGFQRCLDHLVVTPRENSIAFLVDADMVAYPGLTNRIINNTIVDKVRASVGSLFRSSPSPSPSPSPPLSSYLLPPSHFHLALDLNF